MAVLLSLASFVGCTDAVYTLGSVPSESEGRNPCPGRPGITLMDPLCVGSVQRDAAPPPKPTADAAPVRPDGGDVHDSAPACTPRRTVGARKGLNLYLLVDASPTIALQPLWGKVGQGISQFVANSSHDGLGIGVGYYGTSCNSVDYAKPAVSIGLLPGVGSDVTASFPLLPLNGKAAGAALAGALTYARTVQNDDRTRETAIVLMSDGFADILCGSNAQAVTNQALLGVQASPPVRTHVVALGAGPKPLDPLGGNDLAPLDDVAAAGGTESATRIYVTDTADSDIAFGLDVAIAKATPCAYMLPPGIDRAHLALEWQTDSASPATTWPVVDRSTCGDRAAAFLSTDAPDYVQLCPAACNSMQARLTGTVTLREDCAGAVVH